MEETQHVTSDGARGTCVGQTEEHLRGMNTLRDNTGFYHFSTEKCGNCEDCTMIETGIEHSVLVNKCERVNETLLAGGNYVILLVGANKDRECVIELGFNLSSYMSRHMTPQEKIDKIRASGMEFACFSYEDLEKFREHLVSRKGVLGESYKLTNHKAGSFWCESCRDVVERECRIMDDCHVKLNIIEETCSKDLAACDTSDYEEFENHKVQIYEKHKDEIQRTFDRLKGAHLYDGKNASGETYAQYRDKNWESWYERYFKGFEFITDMDIPLHINYREIEDVYDYDAQWNSEGKYWYIPAGQNLTRFTNFIETPEAYEMGMRRLKMYEIDHRECLRMYPTRLQTCSDTHYHYCIRMCKVKWEMENNATCTLIKTYGGPYYGRFRLPAYATWAFVDRIGERGNNPEIIAYLYFFMNLPY